MSKAFSESGVYIFYGEKMMRCRCIMVTIVPIYIIGAIGIFISNTFVVNIVAEFMGDNYFSSATRVAEEEHATSGISS